MAVRGLVEVLEQARSAGFLGPGPVEDHVDHALGFVGVITAAIDDATGAGPARLVDLGSGAGVPGLVIAFEWPGTEVVLVEAGERRAAHLVQAVAELGLGNAVVRRERAEATGRSELRGRVDLVTARGFGRPAATAECAAPLLAIGGRLIVSEPPDDQPGRWPAAGLDRLALVDEGRVEGRGAGFRVLRSAATCPDRYPRRDGVPQRKPLF